MHLVILTQYYPPEIGAPQKRLSELAERLVRRGHAVTVLTAMPNYPTGRIHEGYGGLFSQETLRGVTVLRCFVHPSQSARTLPRLANYLSFVASSLLLGVLTLPRADALLVESPPLFLGVSGYLLSRALRMRLIFNVSDLWPESVVALGRVSRASLQYRASAALERFLYRAAWLVTGQSRDIIRHVEAVHPAARTWHLSNGVDVALFHPATPRGATLPRLAGDTCTALYAGLHGIAQGLEQLLDAAELLNGGGVRVCLVGDGPEKLRLRRDAERRRLRQVTFLDPVPAAAMPALLASADIAVVTLKGTIPGAVPSKIYEAMAAARPVVLMADGEAAAIIRDNDAGIALRPGDARGLADAIAALAADPALRARYGANGRRAAEEKYNRDRIAARFAEFLERELGEEDRPQ
jgi:glycosyltransferase involved in cell wall biosynthesis